MRWGRLTPRLEPVQLLISALSRAIITPVAVAEPLYESREGYPLDAAERPTRMPT